jgi:hypothetical protein
MGPDRWLGMVGGLVYVGPQGDVYETGFAYTCRSDGKLRGGANGTQLIDWLQLSVVDGWWVRTPTLRRSYGGARMGGNDWAVGDGRVLR